MIKVCSLLLSVFYLINIASADGPAAVDPAQLSHALEQSLLNALFHGGVLALVKPSVSEAPLSAAEWLGREPEFASAFPLISLNFASTAKDATGATLSFSLLDNQLNLHTSERKRREVVAGDRRLVAQQHRFFQTGSDASGFVVLVASSNTTDLVGALICPRKLNLNHSGQIVSFVDSGQLLSTYSLSLSAKAKGGVLSGFGPGFARVSMHTSKGIAPPTEPSDRVYSRDPNIGIEYVPMDSVAPLNPAADNLAEGITVTLELQNNTGYKRTTTYRDYIWLKTINLDATESARILGYSVSQGSGKCLAFVRQVGLSHHYEKTALEVPQLLQ